MFKSIPASKIVSVNPSVLSAGGSDLSMNAVFLTKNQNVPNGKLLTFSTAENVGSYFGLNSDEYSAAQKYFSGFDNSTIKPGSLFFYAVNDGSESASLHGASLKAVTLPALKKISGTLTVPIDGIDKTASDVNLSAATSFSNAAELLTAALGFTVSFNEQLQKFIIASTTTGASSSVGFATGTAADALGLSEKAGAVQSVGVDADTAETIMTGVTSQTMNWVTFTTIYEPTLEEKMAFAEWSNAQNKRYLYVGWGMEAAATQVGNTSCFGAQLLNGKYSGVAAIYGGLDKAAMVCGVIASIDFTERNGRITLAFKGQSGLTADVTDATTADILKDNGYNFYGAWATANDRFLFLYPGRTTDDFEWIDNFINQIRLNSQLQLALITLLTSAKSVPYNAVGKALQRAACQDAINEAINFGSIQSGVNLSEQQAAIINNDAGVDAASQIEANGYYLMINDATTQTRGQRKSMPIKLWYTDGGSVHEINVSSINIL